MTPAEWSPANLILAARWRERHHQWGMNMTKQEGGNYESPSADLFRDFLDRFFHNCPFNADGKPEPNDYAVRVLRQISDLTYAYGKQEIIDARARLDISASAGESVWRNSGYLPQTYEPRSQGETKQVTPLRSRNSGTAPRLSTIEATINLIIRDVAELPDRVSPDEWPEAMLVTSDELRGILRQHVAPPPPAELGLETTEASLAMIRWAGEHPDDPRDWSMFHRMVRNLLDDCDRLSAEVARLTNRYESMDEQDE